MFRFKYFLVGLFIILTGCGPDEEFVISISRITINGINLNLQKPANNPLMEVDKPIEIVFGAGIDISTAQNAISLTPEGGTEHSLTINISNSNKTLTIIPDDDLMSNKVYTLAITSELKGEAGDRFKSFETQFKTKTGQLQIVSLEMNNQNILPTNLVTGVAVTPTIELTFSAPLDSQYANSTYIKLFRSNTISASYQLSNQDKTLTLVPDAELSYISEYEITLTAQIKGANGESFTAFNKKFYTVFNPNPNFPVISDDELLTKVQQQTFKYFYDYAEPNSGMARERNGSNELVTTGGTGFGLMAMVVAIERNFITRQQGINRLNKIVSFLETADRFHGAWSHWVNGNTGKVIPFSTKDNGGDLVETSFLVQGLLTFRQYLEPSDTVGNNLINRITDLYEGVEWDWYRKDNSNVLYWHWSPNYGWEMNFAMYGYFEQQITYFLAAASPTHSIPKIVYSNGYGQNGAIVKNSSHYGYTLPLGGLAPLFWTQYSYLGLDPHFSDDYANYWTQNKNASLIHQAYCIANPKQFVGYSENCWGLTSSDNQSGYSGHSPTNDLGVITPTAALAAFPYTPDESMKALKFFYYTLGDRLWGEYGFYDAFNITEGWTASSYLAIDQGPIIVMIENHRTGLLWDLFMSAPEVQAGITKLNFTY
jgi:hypothetical protein